MGKYKMKNCKEIAEIDVASQGRGVRTRARTLAAMRRRTDDVSEEHQKSYLELRSRRLLKITGPKKLKRRKAHPEAESSLVSSGLKPTGEADPITSRCSSVASREGDSGAVSDLLAERSVGEKNRDYDFSRCITERVSEADLLPESESPASLTGKDCVRSHNSSHNLASADSVDRSQNSPCQTTATAPPASEIEAFFAAALSNEEQRRFTEKYNYDVVKDVPLPGRFEWAKTTP